MNYIPKSILVLFLIGSGLIASGQDNTFNFSISEAQAYALRNNRTVQSTRIDIELAGKKIRENLAQGFPQVNVDANYLHQFVIPEVSFGPFLDTDMLPDGSLTKQNLVDAYVDSPPIRLGVRDNTTIDFTVSQLIFNGQYIIGTQVAKVVRQVSQKNLEKTEDQTKELVAGTYYLILVLQENRKLLNESLKALNQMYDEMVKINQQGLNEETDVDQVNVSRSNIQTLITSIGSQIEISNKLLKYQLGLDFGSQVNLTDNLTAIVEQGNLRYLTAPEFRLENSVDYQLIGIQERISEMLVKLERSKYLPSVTAFYRHQEQTNQPSFNFAVKDVVGATLNLPIVTSGMRSSKVSQAKYDLQKIRLNKLDAEQGLTMEFETARNNYQTAYSNFMTNRQSMDLSKKIFDRTVIKYREGVSTSFDLAQNQNQFLAAETNYYNSLLSLLNAKAKLDRIMRIN